MNQQSTLTGERKIMNMPKSGTVLQFRKPSQLAEKPIESMRRPVHYAKTRLTQGGIVGGTVSHFTYQQLPAPQQIAAASYPEWSTTICQHYWHLLRQSLQLGPNTAGLRPRKNGLRLPASITKEAGSCAALKFGFVTPIRLRIKSEQQNLQRNDRMKIYLFFLILIAGFTLTITAAVRPDVIEKSYNAAKAPFEKFTANHDAEVWRTAKEQERARWMLQLKLPLECAPPATDLKRVECQNLRDMHLLEFEKVWRMNIANGWHP